jgi:hypothetical protein
MTTGSIPKKISYVYSASKIINNMTVYPAYPVVDGNPRTLLSAKSWAENQKRQYDTKTNIHSVSNDLVMVDTFDNNEIDNVRIVDLESRGNGGRAYKAIINDKYYVDVRENVILDCIQNTSIIDQKLSGKFKWVSSKSMNLLRVGSNDYKDMVDADRRRNMKCLKIKDLKPHTIYANKKGIKTLFIDFVDSIIYSAPYNDPNPKISQINANKHMLIQSLYFANNFNINFDDIKLNNNSIDFVEEVETITLDDNLIKNIKEYYENLLEKYILDYSKQTPIYWGRALTKNQVISMILLYSGLVNMEKVGNKIIPFDYEKWFVFA